MWSGLRQGAPSSRVVCGAGSQTCKTDDAWPHKLTVSDVEYSCKDVNVDTSRMAIMGPVETLRAIDPSPRLTCLCRNATVATAALRHSPKDKATVVNERKDERLGLDKAWTVHLLLMRMETVALFTIPCQSPKSIRLALGGC